MYSQLFVEDNSSPAEKNHYHTCLLMNWMLNIKVTWPLKQVVNYEGLITAIHCMTHRKLLCIIMVSKKSIFLVPCTVHEINSWIKSAKNYQVSVQDNTLLYMCSYFFPDIATTAGNYMYKTVQLLAITCTRLCNYW